MRHEQLSILVLAYVIGFTTAYIAFGLNPNRDIASGKDVVYSSSTSLRDVVESTPNTIAAVTFSDVGMFAEVGDEEVVISGKLTDSVEPGPGFHVDIPFYEVSPQGNFVYYCEQHSEVPTQCSEYIYSLETHSVHPIKIEGMNVVSTDTSEQNFVWNDDETASYKEYSSVSAVTPWVME